MKLYGKLENQCISFLREFIDAFPINTEERYYPTKLKCQSLSLEQNIQWVSPKPLVNFI